jgi:hypothetical protein
MKVPTAMPGIVERLRWMTSFARGPIGWAGAALAVAVIAVLLWFRLAANNDGQYAGAVTQPAAGGDVLPPPEDDADHATAAGAADPTTQDIIPPDEP